MYTEYSDMDFNELTIELSYAFYGNCNDKVTTLMQELQWRIENTSI